MKILFVNTDLGYGGASKMLISVANNLSKSYSVTICTLLDNKQVQFIAPGVNLVHKPLADKGGYFISRVRMAVEMHHFIKEEKFDVCIAFLDPAKLISSIAVLFTHCKLILSERGNPTATKSLKMTIVKLIRRVLQPSKFIFQTSFAKELYPEAAQKIGVVINNAIPPHPFVAKYDYEKNINREIKTIVHVGRLDNYSKRQDLLLKAFAKITKKYSNMRLCFLGDGDDETELKNLAQQLSIADKVIWKGYTANVLEVLMDCFIFVLSSDHEGIPNALLEAMSVGIPCISTDCRPGGARLMLSDPSNGLLIPCGDPDAISDAVFKYIQSPELWKNCGIAGCKYVNQNFSEENIAQQWKNVIREITN